MVVIDPNLGDAEIEKEVDRIKEYVVGEGGEISSVDLWGRRKMSFEIGGRKEGYYALIKFKAEPRVVAPLVKAYRLNEQILRHIVVVDNFKEPLGIPERRRSRDDDEDGGDTDFRSGSRGED
jgi:small subunit ribosomal protein S6